MENIYATANGRIDQSDKVHSYFLFFKGTEIKLPPCSLIGLRSKLNAYNIEEILLGYDESSIEILPLCNRDRFLVLTLTDLIELKELINGTFAMLELNSIVCNS